MKFNLFDNHKKRKSIKMYFRIRLKLVKRKREREYKKKKKRRGYNFPFPIQFIFESIMSIWNDFITMPPNVQAFKAHEALNESNFQWVSSYILLLLLLSIVVFVVHHLLWLVSVHFQLVSKPNQLINFIRIDFLFYLCVNPTFKNCSVATATYTHIHACMHAHTVMNIAKVKWVKEKGNCILFCRCCAEDRRQLNYERFNKLANALKQILFKVNVFFFLLPNWMWSIRIENFFTDKKKEDVFRIFTYLHSSTLSDLESIQRCCYAS